MKMNKKDYLKKIINFYYEKKSHVPGMEWVQKKMRMKTDISIEEIQNIIDELVTENFLVKKGKNLFLKNKNKEDFTETFFIKEKKEYKEDHSYPSKFEVNNKWIDILRYVLLIIGIGAVYMSIYYSYIWLLDFLSFEKALLLSLILVCFATISFEFIVFFHQLKKYFLVGIFGLMWIIITFFSMTSTIAGQYNSRMGIINKRYESQKNIESSNREYLEYVEQKKELQDSLKILKEEYTTYQNLFLKFDTEEKIEQNKTIYRTIEWRKNKALGEMKTLISLLKKLREKKEMRKVVNKSVPDFYVWVGEIWKWGPNKIQFWLSIFPAIFIDILAPLSFAVVIFVRRK